MLTFPDAKTITVKINQSSFRLLEKNIPSNTDAGGIYNTSMENIKIQLIR